MAVLTLTDSLSNTYALTVPQAVKNLVGKYSVGMPGETEIYIWYNHLQVGSPWSMLEEKLFSNCVNLYSSKAQVRAVKALNVEIQKQSSDIPDLDWFMAKVIVVY